jgi:serine/threonine protein kinase
MAPEQAAGRATDKRVDIWAFGLVVWEMLTGDRPFVRGTPAETLAAVISSEPDFARVPPRARRLLRRCLEKDPKRRLRDIGEVVFLLDDAAVASVTPQSRRAPWIIAAVAVMAAAILSAVVLTTRQSSPAPRPLMRFDLAAESDASYDVLSAPRSRPTARGYLSGSWRHEAAPDSRDQSSQGRRACGTEGRRSRSFRRTASGLGSSPTTN